MTALWLIAAWLAADTAFATWLTVRAWRHRRATTTQLRQAINDLDTCQQILAATQQREEDQK